MQQGMSRQLFWTKRWRGRLNKKGGVTRRFMLERKDGHGRLPFPMITLALQWQTLLVRDRGKSFLLLDLEKYDLLWHQRRQLWEQNQLKRDLFSPLATHKKAAPIKWPAWMLN